MSYTITKKGNGFFVENTSTKRVMGHHKTLAEARAQVKAVNADEASTRSEMNKAVKVHMSGTFPRPPKPQGKGIVKALGQTQTTGRFKQIEKAKGKGAAIGALQNKLAKREGKPAPYHR